MFTAEIIENLSNHQYDEIIDEFYTNKTIDISSFQYKDSLHPQLKNHPQLKWLKKRKESFSNR